MENFILQFFIKCYYAKMFKHSSYLVDVEMNHVSWETQK